MKMTRWLGLILVALMTTSSVRAQQPAYRPAYGPPAPLQNQAAPEIPPEAYTVQSMGLSDYLTYRRDCCEGKHGRMTPLSTEVYFFSGPSIPIGTTTLSRELQIGWSIGGGAKALFFNEQYSRAWVVDAHIINTNETSSNSGNTFPLTIFRSGAVQVVPAATVQSSNRTSVGLGMGRAWYLWQPANHDGRHWRMGMDMGGRYGSHILMPNESRGIKDIVAGMYCGAYTNLECPWRQFMFQLGSRMEWSYMWNDVLQRNSDIQEISILFSAGVRY